MFSQPSITLKALLLLAAFSSLLQAFQGTPFFCHMCRAEVAVGLKSQPLQHHACGCCEASSSARRSSIASSVGLPLVPTSPCPADCFCKQLPQPKQAPAEGEELEDALQTSVAVAQMECGQIVRLAGILQRDVSRLPAKSAARVCVDLCRFQA